GVYTFPTIDSLVAGTPSGYVIGYANSRQDSDIPADFHVQVYSLYAQDQWTATDRLTVTAGLRVDIPRLLDKPSQNDTLTNALAAAGLPDVRTGVAPKTMPLVSPRLGVNINDRNFRFPQYFGVSAGFDRQLPYNTVLTVEGLYRKAINGVLIRDANIKGPRMVGGQPYTDRDGRVLYADTISAAGVVTN